MKDVNFFMSEPGNRNAILSVSALARAMKELDKVAILRCVWRQGQDKLVIGVLTPHISDKDNIVKSLYATRHYPYLFVSTTIFKFIQNN